MLERIVKQEGKKIVLSKSKVTSDKKDVEKFFKEAVNAGNEGLMFKALNAPYKPGARVGYMIKFKALMETLDLVIVGAEWGEGKRAKWLSSYTIACTDEDGNFFEIGKVSTGLKEKSAEEVGGVSFHVLTEMIKPLIIKEQGRQVEIKPKIVLSVTYQEIQHSPNYQSGFALRFPRFTALRPDKSIKNIATIEEVKKDYELQKRNYQYG